MIFFKVALHMSMTVTTNLLPSLSSVVDLEKNNGSAARPYYMSGELRRILNKKNVKPRSAKKK